MRAFATALAGVAVASVVAGSGWAIEAATAEQVDPPALGPGEVTVRVDVEHSRFEPSELRVVQGTRVRFVVANEDPIGHELIVGPPDVHARHRSGTHARHGPIPGEVSVGAGDLAVTAFRFDDVGIVELACHLPGHYDFGMRGAVEVVPVT